MKWPLCYKISLTKFHAPLSSYTNISRCYRGMTNRASSFTPERPLSCGCPLNIMHQQAPAVSHTARMHAWHSVCKYGGYVISCHDSSLSTLFFFFFFFSCTVAFITRRVCYIIHPTAAYRGDINRSIWHLQRERERERERKKQGWNEQERPNITKFRLREMAWLVST